MNQPTPFAALGAVAKYALQQMAPPPLRPFQAWLTFATSAAPCEDATLCSCVGATASRPTGRRDHSSSPASARV
ncbi:hypothetical protein [Streptomyces mirabilis]|uniref:Uncharacterized protein n=1 Tax=Streptomyces mirabilis TaxID=68239 RepID=A0A1I2JWE6_9ACTN|nr:hypothetical protein [Streptomyces mirabilis]SFF58904.1 hypothetical protein SAMN02787118_10974 [Streptomyces mirabilis]